jgi:hypothetical protein
VEVFSLFVSTIGLVILLIGSFLETSIFDQASFRPVTFCDVSEALSSPSEIHVGFWNGYIDNCLKSICGLE